MFQLEPFPLYEFLLSLDNILMPVKNLVSSKKADIIREEPSRSDEIALGIGKDARDDSISH